MTSMTSELTSELTSDSFKPLLKKLISIPEEFTYDDTVLAMTIIMSGKATAAQIGSFLTIIKLAKIDKNPKIVEACVRVLREHANLIHFEEDEFRNNLVDIVGTGGDGHDTFNVSTASAIISASCGAKVVKHGNRASTSKSGSSDFLQSVGYNFEKITKDNVPSVIKNNNFCFLFAPLFHPAWVSVSKPRKELGFPTIFNYLGPLSNPARPGRMVVGVYSKELGKIMAETLLLLGAVKGMVVHGKEGLDEISIAGETFVWEIESGKITERIITPEDFGLSRHELSLVKGGTSEENAKLFSRILNNEYHGPILDFILLNTSAVLVTAGIANDFKHGVEIARKSIANGKAKQDLGVTITNMQSI
ncbi:hypothetical protein K502DRAFT_323760 [Neoconidiobolus thromboides FSU 785]|nr:hypothetical protein K502DRAFT_323760 [Neoconidiobolus thromboides FSU 785]